MVLITQSWKELKDIMSSYVGIVRVSDVRLKRALNRYGFCTKKQKPSTIPPP
jgi:aspartate oxidase